MVCLRDTKFRGKVEMNADTETPINLKRPIAHAQWSATRIAELSIAERQQLLCITILGEQADLNASVESWQNPLPLQQIAAPLLCDTTSAINDVWYSANPCRAGEFEGIHFRCDEHILYGVIVTPEALLTDKTSSPPLQRASEEAYRRIFRLLDEQGYAHLWRAWNYLSDINVVSHGLERYQQFNIGRHAAFVASGRLASDDVPAASALGVRRGPLTIAFMAGRRPSCAVENPRQVSAYLYPAEYGPRSPTFSRATLAQVPGQELFFISGTAGIVGHRSMHVGDVARQTQESMDNITAVMQAANEVALTQPYQLCEFSYRVYIRFAEDFVPVKATIEQALGQSLVAPAAIVYIQADICRSDLLVEIEAAASHSKGNG